MAGKVTGIHAVPPPLTAIQVFTTAIDNSSWTAIPLPAGIDCNTALGKCRSATNKWLMSHASGGSPYITFEAAGTFVVDIEKTEAGTLYYVKGTVASDTFEVVLGRRS